MQPFSFYLLVDIGGHKRHYAFFGLGFPEIQSTFHKPDDLITAFNVTLFPQKMNERVPALAYFINLRGDIPESSLGSDVIKIGRKKTGQLFGQVINRANVAV